MAYQTGTFTSPSDLRTTLETFATTNGWTLSTNVLHKNSCYVELFDDAEGLRGEAGTGVDGGDNLLEGAVRVHGIRFTQMYDQTMSLPGTYHLISLSSPDNIFLVVNYNVTYWQHMAFGEFRKFGVWTGGQYLSGSCDYFGSSATRATGIGLWLNYNQEAGTDAIPVGGGYCIPHEGQTSLGAADLRCELDGETWRGTSGYAVSFPNVNYRDIKFWLSAQAVHYLQTINTWNDQTILAPAILQCGRPAGLTSIIGDMPHIRYLRIDNINDGEVITVGSQDWIAFPHIRKVANFAATNTSNHSSVMGWCIKYDGP